MISFFNTLNGWQRLYVFMCIISALIGYGQINIPEVSKDSLDLYAALPELPKRPCEKKNTYECDIDIRSILEFENIIKFVVSDGSYFYLDNRYKQEQIQKAYDTALSEATKKRKMDLLDSYKSTTATLLTIFISVYAFGWMIGWIRNGFIKNKG